MKRWAVIACSLAGFLACGHTQSVRISETAHIRDGRFPVGWPSVEAFADSPAQKPRIAIVIDDVGRSIEDIQPFVELDLPMSYAVLPFLDNSRAVAWHLVSQKQEVLVHVPMEPMNVDAMDGPSFLQSDMDASSFTLTLSRILDKVPGAVGANNHMGSKLTANSLVMDAYIEVLKSRGMYALDSRTTADSKLLKAAKKAGVPTARRHVFLDDDNSVVAIKKQVLELIRVAKKLGCAIAIGHARPNTLVALTELAENADTEQLEFVTVSDLLNAPCAQVDPPPPGYLE